MNAIVVVDEKWGIGKNNDLLFHLPKDMEFFKHTTTGKIVVMGSRTYASFPHGALPNRINIVLDDRGVKYVDAVVAKNVDALFELLKPYNTQDVFVIGGASVYSLLLGYCKCAFVTKVVADGGAEVFFPNLDKLPNWKLTEVSQPVADGEYTLYFCKYENILLA